MYACVCVCVDPARGNRIPAVRDRYSGCQYNFRYQSTLIFDVSDSFLRLCVLRILLAILGRNKCFVVVSI